MFEDTQIATTVSEYGNGFGKRLVAAGVIPPMTRGFDLHVYVDDVVTMNIESFVTLEQYEEIVAALESGDAADRLVRKLLLTPITTKDLPALEVTV